MHPCFFWRSHTGQHCLPLPASPACTTALFHLAHLPSFSNAPLPSYPCFQTSYPLSTHFVSPFSTNFLSPPSAPFSSPHVSGCFPILPAFPSSPDSLRVFQWNAGSARTRSVELLHFILSYAVDFVCIQEFNLNSSSSFRIPGSNRTHLRSCNVSLMTRLLAVASSFSLGRAYPSLNFLSSLSFHLTPTQILWGMFMLPLFALLRRIPEPTPFPPYLPSSRNLFYLGDFSCHFPSGT